MVPLRSRGCGDLPSRLFHHILGLRYEIPAPHNHPSSANQLHPPFIAALNGNVDGVIDANVSSQSNLALPKPVLTLSAVASNWYYEPWNNECNLGQASQERSGRDFAAERLRSTVSLPSSLYLPSSSFVVLMSRYSYSGAANGQTAEQFASSAPPINDS